MASEPELRLMFTTSVPNRGLRRISRGVDLQCLRAISCGGLKDIIGGLCPDDRLWVMGLDEGGDGGLELMNAAMDAALTITERNATCYLKLDKL